MSEKPFDRTIYLGRDIVWSISIFSSCICVYRNVWNNTPNSILPRTYSLGLEYYSESFEPLVWNVQNNMPNSFLPKIYRTKSEHYSESLEPLIWDECQFARVVKW